MKQFYTFSKAVFIATTLLLSLSAKAQITYIGGQTAQQLLQTFISPTSGTVSNPVLIITSPRQYGIFNDVNSVTGMNGGIVLSSGYCDSLVSTNSATFMSDPLGGNGDNDVLSIAQQINPTVNESNDAAVFEFDFTPYNDTINFNYVFGSEEYNTYVGSEFTDAFGFFISGGIQYPTPKNIAIVPGSVNQTPVAINTINNGLNAQYFIDNEGGTYPFSLNGYTRLLKATAIVTPCVTYHLKLAIADITDDGLNSYVFLQSNSFSTSGTFTLATNTTGVNGGINDTTLIEGCNNGSFILKRISNINQTIVVPITYSGTATSNADFTALPTTITFNPGDTLVQIPVTVIDDAIAEGAESITISFEDPNVVGCDGFPIELSLSFYITDLAPLQLNVTPQEITTNGCNPTTLTANVTGGSGSYSYSWSNGLPANAIVSVNPTDTTTYYLTVSDACQIVTPKQDSAIVNFEFIKIDAALTATQTTINACQTTVLNATAQNGIAPYFYSWNNGLPNGANQVVAPQTTTTYQVIITDDCVSEADTALITITVNPLQPLGVTATTTQATVNGCEETQLIGQPTGGSGTYTYTWSNGLPQGATVTVLPQATTTYTLTLTDNCGTPQIANTITITVTPDTLIATIEPASPTILCGESISLSATTAGSPTGFYQYLWSTGDTTQTITVTPNSSTSYSITITDSCGSIQGIDTVNVKVDCGVVVPTVFTPNDDPYNQTFAISGIESYPGTTLSIYNRWGRVVYQSDDYKNEWDGGNNTQGVYYYILDIKLKGEKLQGVITLLK